MLLICSRALASSRGVRGGPLTTYPVQRVLRCWASTGGSGLKPKEPNPSKNGTQTSQIPDAKPHPSNLKGGTRVSPLFAEPTIQHPSNTPEYQDPSLIHTSRLSRIRVPTGEKDEAFTPQPLSYPLGLPYPPSPGQNTGIDPRTLSQRRDDLVDKEKHLQRRKEMTTQFRRPYFRDWTNLRYAKGKSFLSNRALFKAAKAYYFPNLRGTRPLLKRGKGAKRGVDTTPVLKGSVSVVAVHSSLWAEEQSRTFTDERANPEMRQLLAEAKDVTQFVEVTYEDNTLKAWMRKLFTWNLRRQKPEDAHSRYFLIRKGLDREIRDAIGYLNLAVGYVYLLDSECRIRWAGSGPAEENEKRSLNDGLRKLIAEARERLSAIETVEKPQAKKAAFA